MTPDQVVALMRQLLQQALVLSAPLLLLATAVSLVMSLLQTVTSLQDQTLGTVPRVLAVALAVLAGLPWFVARMTAYTLHLFADLHPYTR